MEEPNKLPLKRVEFSLTKFNDVAIPHHLDLLRQHKANILKIRFAKKEVIFATLVDICYVNKDQYEEGGLWSRVRSEQTHAARVARQLRGLLAELEALRNQVQPCDHPRFDALTQRMRDNTLRAIVDYLGIIETGCRSIVTAAQGQIDETSPLSINRRASSERDESQTQCVAGSLGALSTDSVGVVAHDTTQVQLQVDEQELSLRERESVLEGWCSLQSEVRALHSAWHTLATTTQHQHDAVGRVDTSIAGAQDNVQAARSSLSRAEKFGMSAGGAGGALVGALLGGPVGLLVGVKAGAAAMLAGSAAGYWTAAFIGEKRKTQLAIEDRQTDTQTDTNRHTDTTPGEKEKTQ